MIFWLMLMLCRMECTLHSQKWHHILHPLWSTYVLVTEWQGWIVKFTKVHIKKLSWTSRILPRESEGSSESTPIQTKHIFLSISLKKRTAVLYISSSFLIQVYYLGKQMWSLILKTVVSILLPANVHRAAALCYEYASA